MRLSKLLRKRESGEITLEEARRIFEESFLKELESSLYPPIWKKVLSFLWSFLYAFPFYLWDIVIYPVVIVIQEVRGELVWKR